MGNDTPTKLLFSQIFCTSKILGNKAVSVRMFVAIRCLWQFKSHTLFGYIAYDAMGQKFPSRQNACRKR